MRGNPSLHAWAGGNAAFIRMIDAFYDRAEHADLIAPLFPGGVSREHRNHVATWWIEVFGGEARYTDELGGYQHMLDKHRSLPITSDARRRFVELMSVAADDADLPADPEFRSALMAYVEWGTRLALHNATADANDIVSDAPVPRWGWGEAPPWRP